ncbi:MAG: TAT-variant-translocated molybdopterin oxidoreductase [Verrucomicrobiota bacterium]
MPSRAGSGPAYWRSLDELAEKPEFREWVEREFPAGASEWTDPATRRHFVKIMSASFLLAGLGLTGCRRPEENIVPFSQTPERYIHGVPLYFATAYPTRASAIPLVVKSHEGRPTKIEGNARHPDSNGGTDVFAQASLLSLYDPDRSVRFLEKGQPRTAEQAQVMLAELARRFAGTGGEGLCVLMERSSSPSRARMLAHLTRKLPGVQCFIHEPVDFDRHREAASRVFQQPVAPYLKLDQAKVIVALDHDFLAGEEDAYLHTRQFARGRWVKTAGDGMNRLYVVEALYSLTGANADHRLRCPASQVPAAAAFLAVEVLKQTGAMPELVAALQSLAATVSAAQGQWLAICAQDLIAQGRAGVVLAGYRQPLVVHACAHVINSALHSLGQTIYFKYAPVPTEQPIAELAARLNQGKVDTLLVLGGNPAYHAPASCDWRHAQSRARSVIRLGYYEDETSAGCDWHLPLLHFLESWGDARTADGTLVPVQPLVRPLFGGLTENEVLARLGGLEPASAHQIVRETFQELAKTNQDDAWKQFLHDGFLLNSAAAAVPVNLAVESVLELVRTFKLSPSPARDRLEILFHRDSSLDDGRFNNNGWLQETPDPITKLTWDNAALISPLTAREFGVAANQSAPVMELQLEGRTLRVPVWIQPGLADYVVALALGYGREKSGRVGNGVGFNAYAIKPQSEAIVVGGTLRGLPGQTHLLATTQQHGSMEGRPLVRETTLKELKHFAGAPAALPPKAMYRQPPLDGPHQWGMVIDLSACVGCTACMVACQSENNIPIVGKEQVATGREMSWIRLDRYFTGSENNPRLAFQPVYCLHCENAPCETVCPANATVHDGEGLNVMVYNRCIGTRYCANNCPFKVRRFNFFDYNRRPASEFYRSPFGFNRDGSWELSRWFKNPDQGTLPPEEWDLLQLARNPDVTVRMRGVMEKCTYCVQRIEGARIARKIKAGASGDVRLREQDATIPKTACQQACPAEAITFGDLKDATSTVSQLKKASHNYELLGWLGVRPRTTYLARIRNPNPELLKLESAS